jgi:membrane associated rhomboid family serine protease
VQPVAFVTIGLCVVTTIVTYRAFRDPALHERLLFDPRLVLAEKQWYRVFSSSLIHANWPHCIFNLLSLYLFAENVELLFGGLVLLGIYLASIIGGKALGLLVHRNHEYRSVGASGPVCGVIFSSIFLLPGTSVGMFPIPISIPGWAYAVIFLLAAFIGAKKRIGDVGHEAHFGGAVVGLLAALVIAPSACLAYPWQYFGALGLALACLAAFIIDPMGLKMQEHENYRPHVRDRDYDEARRRNDAKAELDALLDKVGAKGMHGISKAERRRLEELSQTVVTRR